MSESDQFELWFNNQSGVGGEACVYQPTTNVTFSGTGLQQLAWLMAGANPSVWVRFVWTVQYGFIWIDYGPVESFQKVAADLVTANKVTGRKYRVTITLKTGGTEGTVAFLVSGTDKYGGKQSSTLSLPLI